MKCESSLWKGNVMRRKEDSCWINRWIIQSHEWKASKIIFFHRFVPSTKKREHELNFPWNSSTLHQTENFDLIFDDDNFQSFFCFLYFFLCWLMSQTKRANFFLFFVFFLRNTIIIFSSTKSSSFFWKWSQKFTEDEMKIQNCGWRSIFVMGNYFFFLILRPLFVTF